MAPIPESSLVPRHCLSALQGPALGAQHLGTQLTKRETEAGSGDIPCLASPNKWQVWDSNSPSA